MRTILDRSFRTVLDHAPDGVLIECGDAIAYVNSAYASILGYGPAELERARIDDIAHADDVERLRWFGACRGEGKPAPTRYTFRARKRCGAIVTLDASISAAYAGGELLITTIVRELRAVQTALDIPGTKHLSPRERLVVEALLRGKRSKEIALQLGISEKTIWTHRARAFQKLGVRGVNDLFRLAAEFLGVPRSSSGSSE